VSEEGEGLEQATLKMHLPRDQRRGEQPSNARWPGSVAMLMLLLAGCVVFDVAREICSKVAAHIGNEESPTFLIWLTGGIAIWGVEIIAYSVVLSRLPLNVAFPVMSLSYAASLFAGWLILGEHLSLRRWLGTGLITAGVALVGLSGAA
jgi:drug/metabolite transporter (DMT)-like permease